MARPVTIADEKILDAARDCFLNRGMHATTAEVAQKAGVSEGILFKRFGSKAELFKAAMFIGGTPLIDIKSRVGKGRIEEQLLGYAEDLMKLFRTIVPMVMMTWGHMSETGDLKTGEPMPIKGIKWTTQYLAAEMELGRIPKRDPEVAARTLIGAIWHFVMLDTNIPAHHGKLLGAKPFLKGLVGLILGKTTPAKAKKPRRKG